MNKFLTMVLSISLILIAVLVVWAVKAPEGQAQQKSPQNIQNHYIERLEKQGFEVVEVERTWLGRYRFLAFAPGIERELVVNRSTGEILRDFWDETDEEEYEGFFDPEEIDDHVAWQKIDTLAKRSDTDPDALAWDLFLLGLAAIEAQKGEEEAADFERLRQALGQEYLGEVE